MCKKLIFLISFVLLFGLAGSASAAAKFEYRACWWSDLGPGHDANEPNNWWTMDRYWDDDNDDDVVQLTERKFYVKVDLNQVPDVNTVVFVGKGCDRVYYPEFLHLNPPPVDPTISSGTTETLGLYLGGGYSIDPNRGGGGGQGAIDGNQNDIWWDPCLYHELTINGGTLNVGTPQTWEGYDAQTCGYYCYGYFAGNGSKQSLTEFPHQGTDYIGIVRIGTVGWYPPELGPGYGQGTMNMNGGIVNVGGHIGVGGWENTIGTLNMTGGVINITQGLYCPEDPWGATGRVNLSGGTINARYIFMNDFESTGSIDIAGGKFILSRGNEVEELTDYSNGIGTLRGDLGLVWLTAYGVGDGDIITDDVNYPDANGKRADLSIDYDVSNDGKTTVQAFLTDPNQAWAPSPPDGATAVRGPAADVERPILSWSPGDGAASHNVYFGTSFADVNSATTGSPESKEIAYDPCDWTVDSDLVSLGTYYWRIDENPGPVKGQVWDFTMANLAKASLPSPEDGATDVNPVVDLSWVPGIYTSSHNVYFGTNFDDVNDANTSVDPNKVFMGNQGPNTFDTNNYDANGLEFSTTYYWRVDEVNDGNVWPASVWRFTTSDHITVDDMDSYADTTALRAVWTTGHLTNNGAELFIEIDPAFVRSRQSMRYYFRNFDTYKGKYVGSEAEASTADLEIGSDWVSGGPEALVLYFYGDATNLDDTSGVVGGIHQDQMYVAVYDGSTEGVVEYDGDMSDIKEAEWHEWNIDLENPNLAAVDMNNVATVYIGFGGYYKIGQTAKGAGMDTLLGDTVWFDDIGLWPIRCVPAESLATDFTGDCVVNEQDFDIMAEDWLITDYNTLGYMGTLTGFPGPGDANYDLCWVTGKIDSNTALYFNLGGTPAGDEYVKIPPLNLNTNTMSITVWLKRHGLQRDDGGIFFCSYVADGDGVDETRSGFVMGLGGENSLNYNWQNNIKTFGWDPMISVLPADEWAFCALTVAPTWAKIYIMEESTGILYSDENVTPHAEEAFGIPSRIGDHKGRRFVGTMDDFRIYDKTLSGAEVEFLAKLGASGTDPTDANLYAHYTFDDDGGLVALDAAGDMVNWWPVPSIANLVDPEVEGERSVNFRDYVLLANDWLKESPWPPRP